MCFAEIHEVVTKETCTQQLQTIHHCKPYKGPPPPPPPKGPQLRPRGTGKGRDLRNFVDFDPRPQHLVRKQAYASLFNNQCLNYQATYGASFAGLLMPILHIIPPANIYAVANDHDYLADHRKHFIRHLEYQDHCSQ